MKNVKSFLAIALVVSILLPFSSVYAQTPGKKSLPQVPITYSGDTDKTIIRRAQWIEGAKKEGTLVWWNILNPRDSTKLIAEFNKIYPFIKVDYWCGNGEAISTKVGAEQVVGRYTADVLLGGGGEVTEAPQWRKKGMIEKFTNIIPEIGKFNKEMYSKFGDWVQPGNNAVTPQYNTKLISAAVAPKSWEDLLDPTWKGKIGLTSDMKIWIALALAEGGWGIEKTEAFLKKLKQQNIIWGAGHSAAHALVIAGEFPILGEGFVYHVLQRDKRGRPLIGVG